MPSPEAPAKQTVPDDPLATAILELLSSRRADQSICPSDAARAYAAARARPKDPPDIWRRYLLGIRQQALHLARQGRIRILRRGKAVDPHVPVKGVIRLALPEPGADSS